MSSYRLTKDTSNNGTTTRKRQTEEKLLLAVVRAYGGNNVNIYNESAEVCLNNISVRYDAHCDSHENTTETQTHRQEVRKV